MKFDPFKWQQVKPNVENKAPQGMLHIMCENEATLYVTCEGVTAIAGHGKEIRVQIAQPFTFTVKAPKDTDVYVYAPMHNAQESVGEVFTNIDRQPDESGTMLEISRALRQFKLEQAGIRRQVREEMRALQQVKKVRHPVEPEPEGAEVEPEGDAPSDPGESDDTKETKE